MSCSSPLMANISAKPLPESPLELDIKNAKKATRASAFVVDTLAALLFIPLWYEPLSAAQRFFFFGKYSRSH